MTLRIELDEETLKKLEQAAERDCKPVPDWARDQLFEAAKERIKPNVSSLDHLRSHFGAITDPSFAAPDRESLSREVESID